MVKLTETRAFEGLMQATYRKVYNLAYRLSGNRSDAEDLTQEAFFRAYRSFDSYQGDKPFENWVLRIVGRLFLDLLRYRRRRVSTVSYDAPLQRDGGEDDLFFEKAGSETPETALMATELDPALESAIKQLPADQRMVVWLADVEGLSYKEIASLIGAPIGTVRSRLHRTHKALKQKLGAKANGLNLCPT
jgi:RNA polymerase sigma-70 factor (ECF subfamily)